MPRRCRCDLLRHQRGDAHRTGALDEQLGPLHQQHHRVGDRVLLDDDHIVEPVFDERAGDLARPFHRDPIGQRHDGPVGQAR